MYYHNYIHLTSISRRESMLFSIRIVPSWQEAVPAQILWGYLRKSIDAIQECNSHSSREVGLYVAME